MSTRPKRCSNCLCWVHLSRQDGGVGICDNILSDHSQHLLGHLHTCEHWMDEATLADLPPDENVV